ncbi:MFS transporter [Saccharothrix sp.]|uniref:MFS transporter n=1 Tax=Saccharothrix sp. TaxID=1873460 RepID=UPI0035C79DD8
MRKLLGKVAIDTRPLKVVAYRRLWLSTVVTAVGSQLTAVAVPKQVYDITGSSGWVGVSAGVALVPLLVFGLWGGAVADVVDRRKLLVVTNAGIALTSVLLWLQAAFDVRNVWLVITLLGLQQVFFAANAPARAASIARLVPADQLPGAVALGSTVMTFGGVFGPMLAGALMPVLGLPTLYLIDSIALTVTMWAVWKLPPMPPLSGVTRRAGLKDVVDGFRYLAVQKILLASFVLDIIAMVFGMPRALFPEMAEVTFGDPPGGGLALGWLFASISLGAMLCGLVSGWTSRVHRHGVGTAVAVVAWGLAMIGFGFSNALWLAVVFLAIGGAADMISMVFRSAILQTAATDEMRGRMQGVFIVVVAGGPRLADLLHGTVGAAIGPGVATALGGAAVVVATVIAVLAIPAVWRYRFTPEPVATIV